MSKYTNYMYIYIYIYIYIYGYHVYTALICIPVGTHDDVIPHSSILSALSLLHRVNGHLTLYARANATYIQVYVVCRQPSFSQPLVHHGSTAYKI